MTGLLGEVDLTAPVGDRWFADYVPGSVFEFGYERVRDRRVRAGLRSAVDLCRSGVVSDGAVQRVDRQRCA